MAPTAPSVRIAVEYRAPRSAGGNAARVSNLNGESMSILTCAFWETPSPARVEMACTRIVQVPARSGLPDRTPARLKQQTRHPTAEVPPGVAAVATGGVELVGEFLAEDSGDPLVPHRQR